MNPELSHLRALDEADRHISRLRTEVAALPKRIAEIEKQLAGVKAQVAAAQNSLKEQDQLRRNLESEIKSLEAKISKFKDQLSTVKTNEQYKALQHEIDFTQSEIRKSEDRILESMEKTESLQAQLSAAQQEEKRQAADVEVEKNKARELTQKDEAELAEWTAKRTAAREGLSDSTAAHYDRVVKGRGNGVAEARDQKCTACSVMLRPQVYQDIRNGELKYCDSCGRFLFYDANAVIPVAEREAMVAAQRHNE